MGRVLRTLYVRASPGIRTRGVLRAGHLAIPVALGRGGILANKREGDGGTPRGRFRLMRLWWRADREPAAGDRACRRAGSGRRTPGAKTRRTATTIAISRYRPDDPGDRLRRDGSSL